MLLYIKTNQQSKCHLLYVLSLSHCSCGCPALEHIWEADLEACHLLLKGLDHRNPSVSETEDLPSIPGSGSDVLPFTKEEADCAMLTALGGRWCPEADLQHSEFTKVKPHTHPIVLL